MQNFIKSCIPYQGNKYNLLSQIIPLLPSKINAFVDLFCGSLSVGINVNADYIIANDKCNQLIHMFQEILNNKETVLSDIQNIVKDRELSKTNQGAYYDLRRDYNKTKDWKLLYLLLCHSFCNQMRFNKKSEFNLPFGKRSFNSELERRLECFVENVSKKNISFYSNDFRDIELEGFGKDDLVYIDCPYLISTASYNENGGWSEQDELDLLMYLDDLNKKGIRFAMSNVTHHKGNTNELLIEFGKLYNVHELNYDYNNCNYQIKDRSGKTREVLITNYKM